MPKAILALRSYPLAILMALVLFLCTLILATSSTGIIGGGGDEGSGLGGTGKSGLPGDSGFGGTGGPSPFLGDADTGADNRENDSSDSARNPDDWPAPWLPRETETARIPEEIAPLIELQRNPLIDPTRNQTPLFPDNPDALRIIEPNTSSLPSHLRQQIDLANSGEAFTQEPTLEIQLQIPEVQTPAPQDIPALLQQMQNTQTASQDVQAVEQNDSGELPADGETPVQSTELRAVADHGDEDIPEIITETPQQADPRTITERIQRPELPPFQRMRPAVDRASVLPSRPQPMRI